MKELSLCLTVAGSDSGGEAGVQADVQVFRHFDCHALNVITAVTAQNVHKVHAVNAVSVEVLRSQLQALSVYDFRFVKTGMLCNEDLINVLLEELPSNVGLVIDPVMISSSGTELLSARGRDKLKDELFKRAVVVTPNLPEVNFFLGKESSDLLGAAKEFYDRFKIPIYLKGGHSDLEPEKDVLCTAEGLWELITDRLDKPPAVHGTGCRLSSAICANLANGLNMLDASVRSKAYLHACLKNPFILKENHSTFILSQIDSINELEVLVRQVR